MSLPGDSLRTRKTRNSTVSAALLRPLPLIERVSSNFPHACLQAAASALRAAHGGFVLLSPAGTPADLDTTGLSDEAARSLAHSEWLACLIRLLTAQDGPQRLDGCAVATLLPEHAGAPAPGALLGTAIAGPGRPWGILYLVRAADAPPFATDDEQALLSLVNLLKQGTCADEGQLIARLRLLTELAQATAGTLELPSVFAVAMRELERHLPSSVCAIWLTEQTQALGEAPVASAVTLAAVSDTLSERGKDLELTPGLCLQPAQTSFATSLQEGVAVYADWGRPEERCDPLSRRLAAQGATASFALPLRAGDRTVGILQSICFRPLGFTNAQVQLLYLVADLLGPAISNCQLFSRLRTAYEDLHLTQEKLIQAEKMRALGELAGSMAHEFNNALCGAIGFLELSLREPALDPLLRNHLQASHACAVDAARTVRGVQAFARRPDVHGSCATFDLNEVVRQTMEVARLRCDNQLRAQGSKVNFVVDVGGQLPVHGQVTELRQVVTNLVFNALDAMPDGGTLTVRTERAGNRAFLSVSDTGIGIAPAHLRRLFEPFFSTKGERGNGLGLSVVYGIVHRHGGDIAVESQLGCGSTFTVRLPVLNAADAVAAAPTVSDQPRAAALELLVVEDEPIVRKYLETVLQHLGHRVDTAETTEAALAAFAARPYDMVLTDLTLPGGSGVDLAAELARRRPGLPILLITGNAASIETRAGLPRGVSAILTKPLSLDTLAATLGQFTPLTP